MATFSGLISKELTADLEWREAELAVMRKQLILSTPNTVLESALLRAGVAMTYAHYEGFCKFAVELYIDYLEKLKLKRNELIWPLATLSLKSFHTELRAQADGKEFFSTIMTEFNNQLSAEATYERMPQIANLWPDLLTLWLDKLGLSSAHVTSEQTRLELLVSNRNQIAHGKKLIVKKREELDKFAAAALIAMHEVAVGIVGALENKSYKRTAPVQTSINQSV